MLTAGAFMTPKPRATPPCGNASRSAGEPATGRRISLLALSEDRAPDPDVRGAELDRGLVIGAHAHREPRQPVARRDLGEEREMRRGRLVGGRDAHQPFDPEPPFVAAAREKSIGSLGRHAALLRLLAGVDLDEEPGGASALVDFLR